MKYIKKVIDEQILLLKSPTEGNIALVNSNLDLLSIRLSKEIKLEDETDLKLQHIEVKSDSLENLRLRETKLINNLEMYASSGKNYLSKELVDKIKLGIVQEEILTREQK